MTTPTDMSDPVWRVPIRYTPEQIADQRQHCADLQAFLRQKARGTANLRSASRYAEIAAVIDCYMESIEAAGRLREMYDVSDEDATQWMREEAKERQRADAAEESAHRLADILHAFIEDDYIVPDEETKVLVERWRTPKE